MSDETSAKRKLVQDWPDRGVGLNDADSARFSALMLAFDQIEKDAVAGDVAAHGVDRGHTARALASVARRLGRQTYLFDTFEEFDPADPDEEMPPGFAETSLGAVRRLVGTERTTYCKGRFPATTDLVPPETSFCLVHLDCDLYELMLSALEFFYPRMASGGFMLIHDYAALAGEEAERATDAFFADKPEWLVPTSDTSGTAIVRRQRTADGLTWQERLAVTVFQPGWLQAADLAADRLFVDGWSIAEDWGRWGVGEAHVLRLRAPPYVEGDLLLEIDAETVLLTAQPTQEVAVLSGDALLATWRFDDAANRAVRSVRIPSAAWTHAAGVELIFRPRSCRSPMALTQDEAEPDRDDRPLGMAIHRLRARADAEGSATPPQAIPQPPQLEQTPPEAIQPASEKPRTEPIKARRRSWPWVSLAALCAVLGAASLAPLPGGFLRSDIETASGYSSVRSRQVTAWSGVPTSNPSVASVLIAVPAPVPEPVAPPPTTPPVAPAPTKLVVMAPNASPAVSTGSLSLTAPFAVSAPAPAPTSPPPVAITPASTSTPATTPPSPTPKLALMAPIASPPVSTGSPPLPPVAAATAQTPPPPTTPPPAPTPTKLSAMAPITSPTVLTGSPPLPPVAAATAKTPPLPTTPPPAPAPTKLSAMAPIASPPVSTGSPPLPPVAAATAKTPPLPTTPPPAPAPTKLASMASIVSPPVSTHSPPAPAPLPATALTFVTIRFLKSDPRAAQQAADLAAGLREDGFLVGPPVPTLARENPGTRFVFAEDHDAAVRVATVAHRRIADLPATPIQEKPSAAEPPQPGGVGVTLSGKPATTW